MDRFARNTLIVTTSLVLALSACQPSADAPSGTTDDPGSPQQGEREETDRDRAFPDRNRPSEPETPAEGEGEGEGEGEEPGHEEQVDEAAIVDVEIPATLACGETTIASVTVRNTGTSTWTRAGAVKLGAVDDSDPFVGAGRVELTDLDEVLPGDEHTFLLELDVPEQEGTYTTDWRMVREHVRWFGEQTAVEVAVECPWHGRTGLVQLAGSSLVDDQGAFNALGATLFWAPWGYRHDRERLEQNLAFLAEHGFDYIRVLGVVGDPNDDDYWDGREIVWTWPDYDEVIAGLTDLAYDTYGLRVQWTLIGDGQVSIPNAGDRYVLADKFLAMAHAGRQHKVILFETANEAWQNGFGHDGGIEELVELTRYLNERTDILVAASAPQGHDCESQLEIYGDGAADVATIHFDRDVWKTEGHWRPVRQPWGYYGECSMPVVGNNNEPIGPGASVASENDPALLVAAAVATWTSNIPFYVFHSNAGVRGDTNVWEMAGADVIGVAKSYVPGDVASWSRRNHYWDGSPFVVYAGDEGGTLHADAMWPDFGGGATSGVVRSYAQVNGASFFAFPMGVRNFVELEARYSLDLEVIDLMTGTVLESRTLLEGERFQLSGMPAYVVRGTFH